jgi:hypothetical protein
MGQILDKLIITLLTLIKNLSELSILILVKLSPIRILIIGLILSLLRIFFPPMYYELSSTQSRWWFGWRDVHDRVYLNFDEYLEYLKYKIGTANWTPVIEKNLQSNYVLAVFYALGIIFVTLILVAISDFFLRDEKYSKGK